MPFPKRTHYPIITSWMVSSLERECKAHVYLVKEQKAKSICGMKRRDLDVLFDAPQEIPYCSMCARLIR
jgi:hypothetical protein